MLRRPVEPAALSGHRERVIMARISNPMNDIPPDTISEHVRFNGELQNGSLVFAGKTKSASTFQSMEVALFLNGDRVNDRSIYSFRIVRQGTGSFVKFQYSDHGITSSDKYELDCNFHFSIKQD